MKYQIIRMEYNIQIFGGNNIPISPSDFSLHYLQMICTLEIENPLTIIYTYPNISQGYGILDLKNTIEAISNNL